MTDEIDALEELVVMAEQDVMPLGSVTRLEKAKAARAKLAALREEREVLRMALVGLERSLQSLVKERPALAARMGSSTTIGNHLAEARAALGKEDTSDRGGEGDKT